MRLLRICVFCGRDTITENPHEGTICFECKGNAQLLADLETGRKWRENSSLEKWFPFTAERLKSLEDAMCRWLDAESAIDAIEARGAAELIFNQGRKPIDIPIARLDNPTA